MFRLDLPYLFALFGWTPSEGVELPKSRVSFLGCTGPDNEGELLVIKPCDTWGKMAQVKWDSGETSWVRHFDLKYA